MRLILASLFALCFQASAYSVDFPSAGDIPTESEWAVGMISMACKVELSTKDGVEGVIVRSEGRSVIYKAFYNGQLVASAWASSTWITAKKRCL